MHPLDGPLLKIRRAESEIKVLRGILTSLWKDSPYRVVKAEFNPKTGKDVYRIRTNRPPIFLDWGVSIGEIAHNLRSALDGLIYQLALLKTKTPASNTQFPIFLVGKTIRTRRGRRGQKIPVPHFEGRAFADGRFMIQQLRPEHQALIERLQPYKRRRGGKTNPLFQLKEINNADKHRLIQVVAASWGAGPVVGGFVSSSPGLSHPFAGHGRILKDGAKFGEAPPGMDVYPEVMPLIVFWEGCPAVRRIPVTNTLSRIAEHVLEIVEGFRSEFD